MVGEKWYQQTIHYVKEIERVRLYGPDITDRKQAEDALKRTAEQLARSNEELEQFAYVASHDLQEPLRVVTGYVQLIERKYKDRLDADADQFFFYIVDGVARMQQLITDLLNYSRVGTRGAPFRAINVQAVVDRALANLKPVIEDSGATVTYDSLPTVQGDETQLVQVLQNLIGNGIKFHGDRASADRRFRSPQRRRLGVCRPRQRHRHRQAVLGADLRDFPAAAHAAEIPRNRHRTGDLQTHRRTPRRPHLARLRARPRNNFPFHAFVSLENVA